MSNALAKVRALYAQLTEADQLSLLCDLIQGGDKNLTRSDAWIDALIPVDDAFCDAYGELQNAADPDEIDTTDDREADYRFDDLMDATFAAIWNGGRAAA